MLKRKRWVFLNILLKMLMGSTKKLIKIIYPGPKLITFKGRTHSFKIPFSNDYITFHSYMHPFNILVRCLCNTETWRRERQFMPSKRQAGYSDIANMQCEVP